MVAVPRVFASGEQFLSLLRVPLRGFGIAQRREPLQNHAQKHRQPNAFTPAADPDTVESVVPVAAADQRQIVLTRLQHEVDRTDAVGTQRLLARRSFGCEVSFCFLICQRFSAQIRNGNV